jgi:hypothetical protein
MGYPVCSAPKTRRIKPTLFLDKWDIKNPATCPYCKRMFIKMTSVDKGSPEIAEITPE